VSSNNQTSFSLNYKKPLRHRNRHLLMNFESTVNNWWEPATMGILDIGDVAAFLAALIAFSAVFAGISRWWMKSLRAVIKEEIGIATEPIHPNSNGGLSLADVARRTSGLEVTMKNMHKYNQETRDILLKAVTSTLPVPDHASDLDPKLKATRPRKKS
jgi:hypothetical protein